MQRGAGAIQLRKNVSSDPLNLIWVMPAKGVQTVILGAFVAFNPLRVKGYFDFWGGLQLHK